LAACAYLRLTRHNLPCRDAPGGRTVIMNTYAVIAGLSGLAVFCVAALKGFGASR
jgi:hypothetical protein